MKGLAAVADERHRTDKLDGVIKHRSSRETTMVGRGASLGGRLFLGENDGSNPVCSSGESQFKLNGYTWTGGTSDLAPIAAMAIPTFTSWCSGCAP